jgi:hypothetical protein
MYRLAVMPGVDNVSPDDGIGIIFFYTDSQIGSSLSRPWLADFPLIASAELEEPCQPEAGETAILA